DAPMPPRQFANPVLEPGHGLVGDASPEAWVILDREAEERPVPRAGDGTLLRIDLQFEAPFDEAGQARHDPSASVSTADADVTVIRVPHKTVAATLKLAIQFIQDEVREQGREQSPNAKGNFHRRPGVCRLRVAARRRRATLVLGPG